MRNINEIIIHCTATRPDWWKSKTTNQKVAEIRRWHVEDQGWRDIGYHFLIDRNGNLAKGRDVSQAGAHVKGRNANSIGISLFGGHGSSENDEFLENFTSEQDKTLRKLVKDLTEKYNVTLITGHNKYAAKACPGFQVQEWLTQKPAQQVPNIPIVTSPPTRGGLLAWLLGLFGGKA